jgi:hypothetical protein
MLVTRTTKKVKKGQNSQIDQKRSTMVQKNIPVGASFFAHVQTGPGAHPAPCTMGTWSFPGVKRPGRGVDHPHVPGAEVENE